jgi:hypothetical protein
MEASGDRSWQDPLLDPEIRRNTHTAFIVGMLRDLEDDGVPTDGLRVRRYRLNSPAPTL